MRQVLSHDKFRDELIPARFQSCKILQRRLTYIQPSFVDQIKVAMWPTGVNPAAG
jgi:hypothetical protein